MKIDIIRDTFEADHGDARGWTLSHFYIDGKLFGYACEDMDRGLDSAMSEDEIRSRKIKGRTAIPTGTYKCGVHIHNGKPTIHLLDVKGYQWILIHVGNDESDTLGCLLAGVTRDIKKGIVLKSRIAVEWLDDHVLPKAQAGDLTVTVSRDPAAWEGFKSSPGAAELLAL